MMNIDRSNNSFLKRRTVIIYLLSICIVGFVIRLYFQPQVPLTGDATNYFVYAADTALNGRITDTYFLANSGWSLILSGLFSTTGLDNPVSLMQSQRLLSIIISVVTVIPLYFLCRKFFNHYYSIIGVSLFIFEPHLVVNSTLGITEPIFLFFGISTITLFLSKSKTSTYISFVSLGLFSIVRYEGLILFVTLSVLYFIKYRHSKRNFFGYPLILIMFMLTIIPVAYVNFEMHERDGFVSEIIASGGYSYNVILQGEVDEGDPIYGEKSDSSVKNFIMTSTNNSILMMGLLSFPILFAFVFIGIFFILKNKIFFRINFQVLTIILVSATMFIPTLYAYGRGIEDVRFLFTLFPIIILISLYGISQIRVKKNQIMLVGIMSIILIASITYMDLKKIDNNYEGEVFYITKFINERTNIINDDSADLRYRTSSGIIVDWPVLPDAVEDSHIIRNLDLFSAAGYESLNEFLNVGKQEGLEYIIVDGRDAQPEFLRDIYDNEKKYSNLKKIFDSNDLGFKYHVKIFKINFEVQNEN